LPEVFAGMQRRSTDDRDADGDTSLAIRLAFKNWPVGLERACEVGDVPAGLPAPRPVGDGVTLPALMPRQGAWRSSDCAVVNDEVSVQDLSDWLDLVMFTSSVDDIPRRARADAASWRPGRRGAAAPGSIASAQPTPSRSIKDANTRTQQHGRTGMHSLLANAGINYDTLLRQVRAQIGWIKVVNRTIRPTVTVTVDQLDLAVQEARQSEGQPEYLLSEIVLPVDNPAQEDAVAADAAG
jgi:peptidyl-prolyl cis-trans isomerase SurA